MPKPFARAVFLFDYADSDLLHSLENTLRAVNAKCLGLHQSPGAMAARAKAASVAGSHLLDTGTGLYTVNACMCTQIINIVIVVTCHSISLRLMM